MSNKNNVLLLQWGRKGAGPRILLELACIIKKQSNAEKNEIIYISDSKNSECHQQIEKLELPLLSIATYSGAPSALFATFVRLPFIILRLIHFIRTNDIRSVVSLMSHMWSIPIMVATKLAGAKYIAFTHDAQAHPGDGFMLQDWLFQREYRQADHLITLSKSVSNQLVNLLQIDQDKISIFLLPAFSIPVNQIILARTSPRAEARLLFFGRILPYKGIDLLLSVFLQLQAEGFPVTLCIAGQGKLPISLAFQSSKLTVVNRWIEPDETAHFMNNADLLIAPYLESSQSGIVPEAMAFGLPVVATRVGGLVEQVEHMRNGVLTEAVTSEALMAAIKVALLEKNFANLSAGALETARNKNNWESLLNSILRVRNML